MKDTVPFYIAVHVAAPVGIFVGIGMICVAFAGDVEPLAFGGTALAICGVFVSAFGGRLSS